MRLSHLAHILTGSPLSQFDQVVSPGLHHLAVVGDVRGAVVGAPIRVRHIVRQLVLDDVGTEAQHLVEDRACLNLVRTAKNCLVVERRGIEPLTSTMRTWRSPS